MKIEKIKGFRKEKIEVHSLFKNNFLGYFPIRPIIIETRYTKTSFCSFARILYFYVIIFNDVRHNLCNLQCLAVKNTGCCFAKHCYGFQIFLPPILTLSGAKLRNSELRYNLSVIVDLFHCYFSDRYLNFKVFCNI